MRLSRTDLLKSLLAVCAVAVVHPTAGAGQRAAEDSLSGFGGRAVVADVARLAGYGSGPILAAGPGLVAAAGPAGAHALGDAGCDRRGMTYRELSHPRVSLDVDSPGARRLDLIIRTVQEAREVAFTLGGEPIGTAMLSGDWQRVSLRIQPLAPGPHRLAFTMSPTGERLSGDYGPKVQALLHSVRLSTRVQSPVADVVDTFAGEDTLWLEPGETLRMPAIGLAGHALQTDGLVARGAHAGLTVTASLETAEGAIDQLFSVPAGLAIPWNLALDPKDTLAPHFIRITVQGESAGAVALKRPLLTLPRRARPAAARLSATPRLVLVVVPGLRSDDAGALGALDGAHLMHTWATAETPAPALASLLTGRYVEGHGLSKRGDQVASNVTTLARAALRDGRKTLLRAGRVAHRGDKWLWTGYSDAKFAADGEFRHTAEHVLGATVEALQAIEEGPVLATVVLGDVAAPYLPRANAWAAHWPAEEPRPWEPLNGRKELQQQRASGAPPNDTQRAFWRALRRGKVDEVTAALGPFLEQVKSLPGGPTRVVIVGLAGHEPLVEGPAPDLRSLVAPLMITGVGDGAIPPGPFDLTDVHATLRAVMGLAPGDGPGQRIDVAEGARWTDAAHATMAGRWDVMVTPTVTLVGDRMADAVTWYAPSEGQQPGGAWAVRGASVGPQAIVDALTLRRFTTRRGAAARWTRASYGIAAAPGRAAGTGGLCGR